MPTPYGSHGGMAFSADELRVLRRALAIALQPTAVPARPGPERAAEVRDCLRLAQAVDEAVREGGRLRAFLLDELARYRSALPGAATGYLDQLQGALTAGYRPRPEDLAALRALCATLSGPAEGLRRRRLLGRCERLAERFGAGGDTERGGRPLVPRSRPSEAGGGEDGGWAEAAGRAGGADPAENPEKARAEMAERFENAENAVRAADTEKSGKPAKPAQGEPKPAPRKRPEGPAGPSRAEPGPSSPKPGRPVPTPAEVFPPKRRQAPPAEGFLAARPA
ncbi:hypothetical protein [Streptomyces sp. SAJ15]|uniref:hypothetical protein n=1 Tax=Streptomyces sp. SAJ15 TaxID=2011095 RepID=UPI001185FE92|nr:hypothetical protein [Streptomyces sp. SAJ15]TVL92128.1 hypothetical protein CD790_10285 [Streptomyces sp. SAJ15]